MYPPNKINIDLWGILGIIRIRMYYTYKESIKMKVLVACEFSGIVREEFRKLGHDAISCDFEPTEIPGNHYQGNILDIINHGEFDLMIAHPPCTYITVTGNKWFYHPDDSALPISERRPHPRFPDRKQHREEGVKFFMELVNANIPKICVENPVGIMSTRYRKPDQIIQPYEYGHKEPKKTCLWLKGLPLLTPTEIVEPEYVMTKSGKRMGKWYYIDAKKLSKVECTKMRNRTFVGIAKAMAKQWGHL